MYGRTLFFLCLHPETCLKKRNVPYLKREKNVHVLSRWEYREGKRRGSCRDGSIERERERDSWRGRENMKGLRQRNGDCLERRWGGRKRKKRKRRTEKDD